MTQHEVVTGRTQNSGFAIGEITPRGSWRYDWNSRLGGQLRITEPGRQIDDIGCSDRPPPSFCGGRSGTFGTLRILVHIFVAEETSGETSRRVFLFAWGNDDIFEAAILPDTPAGRELFWSGVGVDTDELIAFIQDVVANSDDVIDGVTTLSDYSGSIVR